MSFKPLADPVQTDQAGLDDAVDGSTASSPKISALLPDMKPADATEPPFVHRG